MKFKVGDKVYVKPGVFESLDASTTYEIISIKVNTAYPYMIVKSDPYFMAEDELSYKQFDEVKEFTDPISYPSLIRQWAEDRNLIKGSDSFRQLAKLTEEVGELAGAVAKGNKEGIKDGIGDAFVVLTIIAAQQNLSVEECIAAAYNEIKDRKGRMVDGVFIKES